MADINVGIADRFVERLNEFKKDFSITLGVEVSNIYYTDPRTPRWTTFMSRGFLPSFGGPYRHTANAPVRPDLRNPGPALAKADFLRAISHRRLHVDYKDGAELWISPMAEYTEAVDRRRHFVRPLLHNAIRRHVRKYDRILRDIERVSGI